MIIELPRGSLGESTFERQRKFVPTIQGFATKDAQSLKQIAILIFLIDTNLAKRKSHDAFNLNYVGFLDAKLGPFHNLPRISV